MSRRRLRRRVRQRRLQRSGPWIGACGLLAVLWLAIASWVFAPWWGVALYILAVLVLLLRLTRMAHTDPARCLRLPVYALMWWLAVTVAGTALGGWSP